MAWMASLDQANKPFTLTWCHVELRLVQQVLRDELLLLHRAPD